MIRTLLLASLGLLITLASASGQFDCGTDTSHADDSFLSSIKDLHTGSKRGSPAARAGVAARDDTIKVDAVFHIVAKASQKGDISNDMPSDQLDTLNAAYKDYGFQFNLMNVTWTTNDAWAEGAGSNDMDMKTNLRQGTYRTLNIYFQTGMTGGVLGRCSLPSGVGKAKDPKSYLNDGCNVNANTMPKGNMDGFNKGKTAVHETGHWLGLLHTFEGNSCDGPGDYIDDTAQEKESTDGCPTDKKSCGTADPIHNYMDYSEDECYEGFTAKQKERMHNMWGQFRNGN